MRVPAVSGLAALAVLAASAMAAAAPPPAPIAPIGNGPPTVAPEPSVVASVAPARPGARPVAVSVRFPAALVCGRPRGPVTLMLPAGWTVPDSIAPSAVRVVGGRVARVTVSQRSATIETAAPSGIMCHSVTIGTMRVELTPAAGVGNPPSPGAYAIVVKHGGETYRAPLRIS